MGFDPVSAPRPPRAAAVWLLAWALAAWTALAAAQQLPALTAPVNDFAHVIDSASASRMDEMIRALQTKTGDVVVVATVETVAPYADAREYAVEMFENRGKGVGTKNDNGLLVLLAVKERQVRVEVGYGLEEYITDGFAGETSREVMVPYFRRGEYGAGLAAGAERIIGRIAEARNVELTGVPKPQPVRHAPRLNAGTIIFLIFIFFMVMRAISGASYNSRRRGWGRRRTWSGWNSGIGPFGGGFGGGWGSGGGGGFGGGFGGFGGGRSGGGGGGASW